MGLIYSLVVDCNEEADPARKENWTQDGLDVDVTLRCAWADRYALVNDLLGSPQGYPPFPIAVATAAGITGDGALALGDGGQAIDYTYALVSVKFSTDKPQQVFSESIEPNVEFITLPHRQFKWGNAKGDLLDEQEAPGKRRFSLALTRTFFKVIPPLPGGLLTLVGCVNSASYTSSMLGLTFPAGTLLFMPTTSDRTVTTAGDLSFNVKMKFSYQPEGWNKFWRAKTQAYEAIWSIKGAAVYNNYPLADFSAFLY